MLDGYKELSIIKLSDICAIPWYESNVRPYAILVSLSALKRAFDATGETAIPMKPMKPASAGQVERGVSCIPDANRRLDAFGWFYNSQPKLRDKR